MLTREQKTAIFKSQAKEPFTERDIQKVRDFHKFIEEVLVKKVEMADDAYIEAIKNAKTPEDKKHAEHLLTLEHHMIGGFNKAIQEERKIWKDFHAYYLGR